MENNIVNNLIKEGKYKQAQKELKKESNKDSNYRVKNASIYMKMGNNDMASKMIDNVNIDELSRESIADLITINRVLKNNNESLNLIESLSSNKDYYYYKSLCDKAIILSNTNPIEALRCAKVARRANFLEKDEYSSLALGIVYLNNAFEEEARENLQLATTSNDNYIQEESLFRIACLEQQVNNRALAKLYFDTMIKSNVSINKEAYYVKILSLLVKDKNYEEALNYFNKMLKACPNMELNETNTIKLIIEKGLGLELSVKKPGYKEKQIINYSKEEAIKHIYLNRLYSAPFNNDIEIKDVYEFAKSKLTDSNLCYGETLDVYEIDTKEVANGMNKLRVLTIPNTKDIITMYPHNENKYHRLKDFEINKEKSNRK